MPRIFQRSTWITVGSIPQGFRNPDSNRANNPGENRCAHCGLGQEVTAHEIPLGQTAWSAARGIVWNVLIDVNKRQIYCTCSAFFWSGSRGSRGFIPLQRVSAFTIKWFHLAKLQFLITLCRLILTDPLMLYLPDLRISCWIIFNQNLATKFWTHFSQLFKGSWFFGKNLA